MTKLPELQRAKLSEITDGIRITRMRVNEKGAYVFEAVEFPGKYFVIKKNDLFDKMYGDYLAGRIITLEFDPENSQPGGFTREVN